MYLINKNTDFNSHDESLNESFRIDDTFPTVAQRGPLTRPKMKTVTRGRGHPLSSRLNCLILSASPYMDNNGFFTECDLISQLSKPSGMLLNTAGL